MIKTKISKELFVTSGNIEALNLMEFVCSYIDHPHRPCPIFVFFYGNEKFTKQLILSYLNYFTKIVLLLCFPGSEQYTG